MNDNVMLYWGIALLAVSLLLVVIEAFVPSAGIIALVAAAVGIAGVVCLFKVDWRWGLTGALTLLILGPMVLFFGLRVMPSTPVGKKLMFGEKGEADPVLHDVDNSALEALIGVEGDALTDLRPVGVIRVEGQRMDALSEVSYIRAGTRVKITSVEGTQIKVRPVA